MHTVSAVLAVEIVCVAFTGNAVEDGLLTYISVFALSAVHF